MTLSNPLRAGIFAILAVVMTATRVNHFAALPDASWAVFFIGGFYLGGSNTAISRFAFPLLLALAVLIDYIVISSSGISFWSHYCVSPAYWFLAPAYYALWIGGRLLRRFRVGIGARDLAVLGAVLVAAASVSYLISNGSFYWLSDSWLTAGGTRSLGGWIENLGDWYLPYLRTTAIYVGIGAALHVVTTLAARSIGAAPAADPLVR